MKTCIESCRSIAAQNKTQVKPMSTLDIERKILVIHVIHQKD